MTEQETFDIVVTNLRNQGCQSLDDEFNCAYRGENGLKCAVGWLIPDDVYSEDMEGFSLSWDINDEVNDNEIVAHVLEKQGHNISLASSLQKVHDNYDVDEWENQFIKIAHQYSLTYTPPGEQND